MQSRFFNCNVFKNLKDAGLIYWSLCASAAQEDTTIVPSGALASEAAARPYNTKDKGQPYKA